MYPAKFIERLNQQKYLDAFKLIEALDKPSPVSIRINSEKWDKIPVNSVPVPWSEHGYYLDSRPSFTSDPLFHSGCYYPQEASGMFIEHVFNQLVDRSEKIRVLDLCGAPGGKSTHLSSLIGENGLLVANEVIRSRAGTLAENITKWGLSNTIVTQNDPTAFSRLNGYFDMILVDAPCSGEGMFRDKVAVEEWSEENTTHCSVRQRRILADVWPALKTDGILIYSTCTFNPDENEKNVKWLTNLQQAESVKLDVSEFQGITEIDYQGITGYGFYPDRISGEGFFISVIRKTGRQDVLISNKRNNSGMKMRREDQVIAEKWTHHDADKFICNGNDIVLIACSLDDYLLLSQKLRILNNGTRICSIKNKDHLPSHELSLSVVLRKEAFPHADLELRQALQYLRRDNISLTDAPKGWLLVTYNGISLGFVNNIGSRINNYFPVDWRIRMKMPEPGNENIIKWSQ